MKPKYIIVTVHRGVFGKKIERFKIKIKESKRHD